MSDIHNDKRVFVGSSIRAYDDGRIEGMLVPFTTAEQKDFYNTYFDKRTDYGLDAFPVVNAPALYQHGLDETLEVKPVGKVIRAKITDAGLWAEAQLALKDEYDKQILALAKRGLLSWSSGALPQSVVEAADGHIDRWYIIEASLTPTPATPNGRTQISAIRSISDLANLPTFAELTAKEGVGTIASERAIEVEITENVKQEGVVMTPEQIKAYLMDLLAEMGLVPAAVDMAEVEGMMAADVKEMAVEEVLTDEKRTAIIQNAARAIQASADKRKAEIKNAANAALRAAVKPEDGISLTRAAGVRSADQRAADNGVRNVSVGEDGRYASLTSQELAAMVQMRMASIANSGIDPDSLPNGGVSPALTRTLAARVAKASRSDSGVFAGAEGSSLRAALPSAIRANELDASDITGQGLEWVGVYYGSEVWEKARVPRIYQELVNKGMRVVEIPQGAQTAKFALEGDDMNAYLGGEANSVDATGAPETVVNINPFTTGVVTAEALPIYLATAYTVILGEDAMIDVARQVNYQINEKAQETIEQVILNGDTTRTASTNINAIDNTVPTGLQSPYYLAANGVRKLALVTNTGMALDCQNQISPTVFRQIMAKMPPAQRARKDRMAFVLSAGTEMATLGMAALLTEDVRGAFATLKDGQVGRLYGVDTFTSGFIPLSNTAGKVATATPANNTRGTIGLIYAPYWGFGFKRGINIETARFPLSQSNVYVASMRFTFVARSNTAAAIGYNVATEGTY